MERKVRHMKKVIFGSIVFLAGIVSIALLLAGTICSSWTINGERSALWNLSQCGLTPALVVLGVIAVVGLVIALVGLLDKS